MSELLLRGWNVAVPVVDVGDDVFVVDDTTRRPTASRSRAPKEPATATRSTSRGGSCESRIRSS